MTIDERLQLAAEQVAGAEEAGLDGACGQAEAAGCGRDVHLMKVIQDENVAILWREGLDGLMDGCFLVALLEVAVDGARIVRLVDLVERKGDRRDAAQFGAVEVGGEGKE